MPSTVYIALGTNLGDRATNLRAAREKLPPEVCLLRASSLYVTTPWGYTDQPDFLNQVLEVETDLPPNVFLEKLKQMEAELGRETTFRYGPRQIDIDILLYGDQVVDLPDLTIPHPRLAERAFVLVPLAELSPDLRHPVLGLTVMELLARVDPSGVKRKV